MIPGLPLAFAEPLVLLGLLSLPVLWWLLRLVPPRPRRIDFPPTRMLFDIAPKEETPARTPWWLTLLRLTLAALVIIAAAGPLWNPPVATAACQAPLVLMIDDGFGAAGTWDARMRTAEDLIARADADGRGVALVPLSDADPRHLAGDRRPPREARLRLDQAEAARGRAHGGAAGARPLPDATPDVEIVWLSDGVDIGRADEFVAALARLAGKRPITVVEGGVAPGACADCGRQCGRRALREGAARGDRDGGDAGTVRALDLKGLPLGEAPFAFKSGERETEAELDLPVEIRNDIARLEIADEHSAGAVQLLDKRWRRRTVGVVTGSTADTAQPLLASTYLSVARARLRSPTCGSPIAPRPPRRSTQFIEQRLPMIILADVGNVAGDVRDRARRAGSTTAACWCASPGRGSPPADDDLVPVKLRRGGRILGGSLSWEQPQQLAAFCAREPVQRHDGAERRHGEPPGAGRTRRGPARPHLGDARRRHAARDRASTRQGNDRAVPRHGRYPLVGPAAVGCLRRHAQAHRRRCPVPRAATEGKPRPAPTRRPRGGAADPRARRLRRLRAAAADRTADRRPDFTGRATADNPPGFYGPPEGSSP